MPKIFEIVTIAQLDKQFTYIADSFQRCAQYSAFVATLF